MLWPSCAQVWGSQKGKGNAQFFSTSNILGKSSHRKYLLSIAGETKETKHRRTRKVSPSVRKDKGGYVWNYAMSLFIDGGVKVKNVKLKVEKAIGNLLAI